MELVVPALHDHVLLTCTLDWATHDLHLCIRGPAGPHTLRFRGVCAFDCTGAQPWGPSESINTCSFAPADDGTLCVIEMQSGDTLRITFAEFEHVVD
ncbi:MAG TPA: hypothetical protein PLF40_30600 [Kofleriaceae bacterium]|nr:hypothetical protein [Kofleriaceae bacterium]